MVSIIIPAYNEEAHIEECIRSAMNQTYKDTEIIVVDDGSTDRTKEIAGSLEVKLLEQQHKGAGNARNAGAKEASGDILVFLDADMYFAENTVEELIKPIIKQGRAGTFIAEEKVANPNNKISRMWSAAYNLPFDRRLPENIPVESDAFRAIKKEMFLMAGGYIEERATGEDKIADKVGEKALAAHGAAAYHYNPETIKEAYINAKWFGKGQVHVYKGFKIIYFLLKYNIFKSIPAGIIKAVQNKIPEMCFFKPIIDFAIFTGFICAFFLKDNKK